MENEQGLASLACDLRPFAGKDLWVTAPALSMRELEIAFWQAQTLIVEGKDGCRITRFNGEEWSCT